MNILASEFFDQLEKAATKEAKLKLLSQNNNNLVRTLLRFNFDYNIKFLLAEGAPPYKVDKDVPAGYEKTKLQLEMRRFYLFIKPDVNINKLKRERLFIEMLEGLHWTEAEDFILVKDKILSTKYKTITHELISEAYPGLLPPPLPKEPEPKKSSTKKSTKGSLTSLEKSSQLQEQATG